MDGGVGWSGEVDLMFQLGGNSIPDGGRGGGDGVGDGAPMREEESSHCSLGREGSYVGG